MSRFFIICAFLMLSACASLPDQKRGDHASGPAHIIYSPTGDPLNGGPLGRPSCIDAMKRWFSRADGNHDGAITLDEFLNDARAQFRRMDIDRNGYLVSEEVERFRMAYRDYAGGKQVSTEDKGGTPAESRHGRGQRGEGGSEASPGSVIDPVMSADTNLDYKVTPEEFMAYSQNIFKSLDADHNGTLSLEEVTASCEAKP